MDISPPAVSAVFLLGLVAGSFLNVCIWRLPAGEQVVKGRSHCRACGKTIPWHDNVPVLSFLALGGRCRFCKAGISWGYPATELATGLLLALLFLKFGFSAEFLVYAALAAALVVASGTDLREQIIPDQVTLPGLPIAVGLSFLVPSLHGVSSRWAGAGLSLAGAAAGGGFLWLIGAAGSRIFRREAMGGGDVKLMAMVGAVLGFQKTILANLFLAPLAGSAVGLVLKLRYKKEVIPYGPFLSAGSLAALVWGEAIIGWYWNLWF
ncbi:MAG: prepilin peptidase [Candidatus Omnitrophica bacterium]|nr:prepilin peptidase [Candidatus Omnitrophota bacterium]